MSIEYIKETYDRLAKERGGYRPTDPDFWYLCGYMDANNLKLPVNIRQGFWDRHLREKFPHNDKWQMGFLDGQEEIPIRDRVNVEA